MSAGAVFQTRVAGVVLLWPMLSTYFMRLGMLTEECFQDEASQERTVGLIRFLATGHVEFSEPDLVLGKILCGLPPEWPVPTALELDDKTRRLSEGMLSAPSLLPPTRSHPALHLQPSRRPTRSSSNSRIASPCCLSLPIGFG